MQYNKYYHQKNHRIYKNKISIKKMMIWIANFTIIYSRDLVHLFVFDNPFVGFTFFVSTTTNLY